MKFKIEAECTPEEARAFLGLPDVSSFNDQLVAEVKRRAAENMAMLKPDELMKSWMTMGGQTQEQMFRSFTTAAANAMRGGAAKE
jgi:hypothetical protein